jgi:5-methylcytosine-specific restriction endonuclease McrA
MPKRRLPIEEWKRVRVLIWSRDQGKCTHCNIAVELDKCHIDHIVSGKLGTNNLSNLRTLCRRCHTLRSDKRHQGMISKALRDGIIPPNWRELVWDD